MTKITILNGGKEFEYLTKLDINYIYGYLIDDGFILVTTINGEKVLLSRTQPIVFKEVN